MHKSAPKPRVLKSKQSSKTQNRIIAKKTKKNPIRQKVRKLSTSAEEAVKNAKAQGKTLTLADFSTGKGEGNLFKQSLYYVETGMFHHDGFDEADMKKVGVSHRPTECTQDKLALGALKIVRKSFDLFSGYKHCPPGGNPLDAKYQMTPKAWMLRFIFLESVAGVPGMIGGTVRHLQSIRLLRKDNGWMESLLEEAYNERMHLLTFLDLYKPGYFTKLMILGAQGVFYNAFFLAYLASPKFCHRFVGYLEEEAVITYSRCIDELESGMHAEWANTTAPPIAIKYWHMKETSTVKDLLYYVRADECKHREVNHTLANLHQATDPNPYAMKYATSPHPSKDLISNIAKPSGWKRDEIEVSAAMNPDASVPSPKM